MSKSKVKIAVVILNWNGKPFLEKFITGVVTHSSDESISVVIADNGSNDGSVEYISNNYPDIQLLKFDKNYGFAGGYNKALQEIDADYYVILNSDVEVTPDWIIPVIQFMDSDKDIAAVMPKIKSYANRKYFEYAGAAGGFIDKYGYPFCRGRIFDTIEEDTGQYDDIIDIQWATGACLFIRASDFHQLGGFDDDFFAHMEEIDLCWRLSNAGKRIVYFPDVEVYHVGGGTLPQGNPRKTYLNHRNNLYMLFKNLPGQKLMGTVFVRLILDGLTLFKYLLKFHFKDIIAVIKAHLHFHIQIPALRKKRKANMKLNNKSNVNPLYSRSIVYQYFIKGRKHFSDLKR